MLNEVAQMERQEFQRMIANNEPQAVQITVKNNIDDTPCPTIDFKWATSMEFGAGVPGEQTPTGCSCIGPCNASSNRCACRKRQAEHNAGLCNSFTYGRDGRIRVAGAPIYECNSKCGCPPSCRNRVSGNEFPVQGPFL